MAWVPALPSQGRGVGGVRAKKPTSERVGGRVLLENKSPGSLQTLQYSRINVDQNVRSGINFLLTFSLEFKNIFDKFDKFDKIVQLAIQAVMLVVHSKRLKGLYRFDSRISCGL
jgi:hypothetical protein